MTWKDTMHEAMSKNIDELVIWGVGENDNSVRHKMLAFELQRRATVAQIEAAGAQKDAAEYAKKMNRYMLYSVWAVLFAAAVSAIIACLAWQYPHH